MKHLFLFFLIVLNLKALCQNTYRLSWAKEGVLLGSSGAVSGVSLLLGPHYPALTLAQIPLFHSAQVNTFDRIATRQYSSTARRASDYLLYTAPLWPALLLFDPAIRRNGYEVCAIASEAVALSVALTALTKELAHRPRPFVYNPNAPVSAKLKRDARLSFFSGHTSTVAALSFVSAKVWCDHHPTSRWKPIFWSGAFAVPAAVGYLRVRGGKHFPTDVLAGLAIGAATGWLLPHLHRVQ